MVVMARLLLIVSLGILQLFAPFTHAHASENSARLGLHIPGLEMLGADEKTQVSTLAEGGETDCDVVTVDAGIKLGHAVQLLVRLGSAFSYCLPVHAAVSGTRFFLFDHSTSLYALQFMQRYPPDINSPRAPPCPIHGIALTRLG